MRRNIFPKSISFNRLTAILAGRMVLLMKSTTSNKSAETKPGRIIGYARVSTLDQDVFMQIEALKKYGCVEIFQESVSAQARRRPQFDLMKKHIESGDTVAVYSLSRPARDLGDLIGIVKGWEG